jgi:hypothetical protein
LEQFDSESWIEKWIPSTAKKIVDGVEDEDLLAYRGEWNVESPDSPLIEGDKGLVLKTLAAHSVRIRFRRLISRLLQSSLTSRSIQRERLWWFNMK